MAAFPAYWESVRLYWDAAIRSGFMESIADGSYDKKQDSRMLRRCDALWNDVVIVAVLYLMVLIYCTLWRFLISIITDPSMWYEDAIIPLVRQVPFYLLFVGMYAFWHHRFTLHVHINWNRNGPHIMTAVPLAAEKNPYM